MRLTSLACALVALAAGCGGSAPAPSWPAGTALAVDDVPILAEQIDSDSVYVERIEPRSSPAQLRRLALTNVSLPRVLARMMAPEEHARARQAADEALERVRAGTYPPRPDSGGLLGERMSGGRVQLGMVAWGVAMDLPDGQWSEVVEQPGHFVILRRLERREAPVPMATEVTVDALVFPWLDPASVQAGIEAEHDRHVLTIVDPEWRTIVPELIQSRMRRKP